mgnify:CR=1 FL=1
MSLGIPVIGARDPLRYASGKERVRHLAYFLCFSDGITLLTTVDKIGGFLFIGLKEKLVWGIRDFVQFFLLIIIVSVYAD